MNRWDTGRVTDLVCRMRIKPEDAAVSEAYDGRTFYFCSVACQERFATDRGFYARFAEPAAKAAAVATSSPSGN